MSMLLRKFARHIAQRAVSDARTREVAAKAARGVIAETKQIAKEDDRAYAAGRAVRRAFDKLKTNR